MGLSRPPLAWITTSAPSPQDSPSPRWAARDRKPVWSRQPETGSRSAGRRRGGCRGGWLRAVCSVFSAWDGVHVVRLAAVRGEDAVSCGWSGRCREGRGLRAPRHRPGTRCPARDRCLPGAAGTSQLCAPLPSFGASRPASFPLAGCDAGPQRTFSLVRRLCLGYYKGGWGAGTMGIWRAEAGDAAPGPPCTTFATKNYPAPNVSRAELRKPCPRALQPLGP